MLYDIVSHVVSSKHQEGQVYRREDGRRILEELRGHNDGGDEDEGEGPEACVIIMIIIIMIITIIIMMVTYRRIFLHICIYVYIYIHIHTYVYHEACGRHEAEVLEDVEARLEDAVVADG